MRTKPRPQRFQSCHRGNHDVVITLDPASRDDVLRHLADKSSNREIHLVHVPIQDQLQNVKEDSHHVAVLAMMVECFTIMSFSRTGFSLKWGIPFELFLLLSGEK